MKPTIAAVSATTKTAPAEISLASFAPGCNSLVKLFTTASMAVLVSSTEITTPIKLRTTIHSNSLMPKTTPATVTKSAKDKWIFKLGSCLIAEMMPEKACLKDKIRPGLEIFRSITLSLTQWSKSQA